MSNTLSITTYGNYLAFITEVSKFLVDTMGFTLDTDLAAEYDRAVSQNDHITAFWTLDDNNTKLKIVSNSKTSGLSGNGVLFYYVIGEHTIQINNVTETTLEYCTPQVTTTRTMNVVYHMYENSYAMQFVPYNKSAPNRNTNANMVFINYVIAKLSGVYCCAKGPQNTSLEIYDENGSVQSLATLFDYSAQNNADYAQIGVILNPTNKVGTINNIYSTSNLNPLTDYIVNNTPMFSINSYVALPSETV